MNLISAGLTLAILGAGVAGSVQTYRAKAEPAAKLVAATRPAKPRTVVQWAPCRPPSRLENATCVTEVVRTVVRPAPAQSSAATSNDASWDDVQRQLDADSREVEQQDVYREDVTNRDDDRGEDRESDDQGDDVSGEDRDDHSDEDAAWYLEDRREDLEQSDD